MTTSLKALLGVGGGLAGMQDMQLITASMTWTALRPGKYRITAIGGGSSGSIVKPSSISVGFAQGGTAGGLSQKTIKLVSGNQLSIVIGAGGAARSTSTTGAAVPGLSGGNTTVTGPGISLTAYGGNAPSASAGTADLPEVAGGSASGGDLNFTGGSSPARPSSTYAGTSSGAAVGVFTSVGYPGTVAASGSVQVAGGAGIGGVGGVWSGGGSYGPAVGSSGGPGRALEPNGAAANGTSYTPVGNSFFALLNGQGGNSQYSGGVGGGGGAIATSGSSGYGGWLAGGGACQTGSTGTYYAGTGGFGGGGGAMLSQSSSACFSGKGGEGLVVIEFLGE